MATLDERVTALEQSYQNLVTKDDLTKLFEGLECRLNARIDGVETRINAKMDQMKKDILEAFGRGFTSNY